MATINGTPGNDSLTGDTNGGAGQADSINGQGGDDTLSGLLLNDTLIGNSGSDRLLGGEGADSMVGGTSTADGSGQTSEADTLIGGSGNDSAFGGDGNDLLIGGSDTTDDSGGSGDADLLRGGNNNDTVYGGGGNDQILGGSGSNLLVGGQGADTIFGGTGNLASDVSGNDTIVAGSGDFVNAENGSDSITGTGDAMTLYGGFGNDTIQALGNSNRLDGFGGGEGTGSDDIITINGANNTLVGSGGDDTVYLVGGTGNLLDGGTGTDRAVITGGFQVVSTTGGQTVISAYGGQSTLTNWESLAVCFAAGTDILTDHGEVRVETLRTGDVVATFGLSGPPMRTVLWIGRRRIRLAGHPAADALAPIRIRAGALAEATPHRDLLVSPDHCLYLDGALVPARLLANGTSITQERHLDEVVYYHVELDGHDVLLANGAAAESWLEAGNRAWFENAPLALLHLEATPDAYAGAAPAPCAETLQGGAHLATLRDAIALRAARALPVASLSGAGAALRQHRAGAAIDLRASRPGRCQGDRSAAAAVPPSPARRQGGDRLSFPSPR